jgi:hypothetical protein
MATIDPTSKEAYEQKYKPGKIPPPPSLDEFLKTEHLRLKNASGELNNQLFCNYVIKV